MDQLLHQPVCSCPPNFPKPPPCPLRRADTAVLGPNVALVSTLSSLSPAPPFLFRTYQLPPGSEALAAQIGAHRGKPACRAPRAPLPHSPGMLLSDTLCVVLLLPALRLLLH